VHQRTQHLDNICKGYEGVKVFGVDFSKLFFSTYVHVDFGDVHSDDGAFRRSAIWGVPTLYSANMELAKSESLGCYLIGVSQ